MVCWSSVRSLWTVTPFWLALRKLTGRRSCKYVIKKDPIQQVGFYERPLAAGKLRILRDALFLFVLVETRVGHRVSKGDSARCGERPGSTWTGQATRLDRAGTQTRTRLSPAGGKKMRWFNAAKKEASVSKPLS